MRRRDFIKVVTGSGMAACRARAAGRADAVDRRADGLAGELSRRALVATFRGALAKLHWTEGGNLRIELR